MSSPPTPIARYAWRTRVPAAPGHPAPPCRGARSQRMRWSRHQFARRRQTGRRHDADVTRTDPVVLETPMPTPSISQTTAARNRRDGTPRTWIKASPRRTGRPPTTVLPPRSWRTAFPSAIRLEAPLPSADPNFTCDAPVPRSRGDCAPAETSGDLPGAGVDLACFHRSQGAGKRLAEELPSDDQAGHDLAPEVLALTTTTACTSVPSSARGVNV